MSEIYLLKNNELSVKVVSLGGELKGIYSSSWNREVVWQADDSIWGRSAPILFPIVGKLKDNRYDLHHKSYKLNQHGFARDFEFQLISHSSTQVELELKATQETFKFFPFCFILKVKYELSANKLKVKWTVLNDDRQDMFFSIGAHPGFITSNIEDYKIRFSEIEDKYYQLINGLVDWSNVSKLQHNDLNLSKELFLNDALIFKNPKSNYVDLVNLKNNQTIRLHSTKPNYYGIWAKDSCPFVCLEPWHGVADQDRDNYNFLEKEGLITLAAKNDFVFNYEIELL